MTILDLPSRAEYQAAAKVLDGIVVHTPLLQCTAAPDLWLKPETLQPAGSFKIRGVFHAVAQLDTGTRSHGISTVSAGNTAKALAWAGRHFGVAAHSLMPDSAPQTKIDAVCALGGTPVLVPTAEVFQFLAERGWEREPFAFIHPWTNRELRVGHGSMGLEILSDLHDVDTVFLPVGGGGLLGGVGGALKACKPSVRVVAVEPAGCPSFYASRRAGKPVTVACETMCDGVAVPYMTDEMFPVLDALADDAVLVAEDEVAGAVRTLLDSHHLLAEGAGALALAAALRVAPEQRGVTVCPITGGSIDTHELVAILRGR